MRKLILTVAVLVGLGSAPANAGVLDEVAKTSFVGAVTHSGPGFSGAPPVGLLFLVSRDAFDLTDSLKVTVGVDVRSEFGFASSFGNLGIGGGLRYQLPGVFSVHAGYARTLADFGADSPDSDNRVFVGVGIKLK